MIFDTLTYSIMTIVVTLSFIVVYLTLTPQKQRGNSSD